MNSQTTGMSAGTSELMELEVCNKRIIKSWRKGIVFFYTDTKDLSMEQKLEDVLDRYGIFYAKSETWIDSEKLYEVLYQFEQ